MSKETTSKPSSLTEAQVTQPQALGSNPDTEDMPEAPAVNWQYARARRLFRPRKEAISLRLDADVLDWLRKQGDGYQTRINQILRERMEAGTP